MVLISLQPFVLRKLVLAVAALLLFSAVCFADPVFMTRQYAHPAAVAKPSLVPPQTAMDLPAAQIGAALEIAPLEAGLWQEPARSNDFVCLQLKSLTFSDPNSNPASDLTKFQ